MIKSSRDEAQKNSLLGLVATEKEYVYYAIQLTSKILQQDGNVRAKGTE